jgi:hypothetical protein
MKNNINKANLIKDTNADKNSNDHYSYIQEGKIN